MNRKAQERKEATTGRGGERERGRERGGEVHVCARACVCVKW